MRKFFQYTLMVFGLSSTALFGSCHDDCYDDCRCDSMGCGFLGGAYGSFHIFYYHAKDEVFHFDQDSSRVGVGENGDPEFHFHEYDLTQRAPGGGGFIGYGMPFCNCFSLALKAGVTGFGSSAEHIFFDSGPGTTDENYRNELCVRYIIDLSFQLGTQVTECFLVYFNFGASHIEFRQTYKVINDDPPLKELLNIKRDHHEWGYVFGAGTTVALTRCFDAFVQYDWHSYPGSSNGLEGSPSDSDTDKIRSCITRLYSGGFTAGLAFNF